MSTYKPADSRKEEFRKYLERTGVIETISKAMVELYEEPEKPQNAVDFMKSAMNAGGDAAAALQDEIDTLQEEVTRLRVENAALKAENEELKQCANTEKSNQDKKEKEGDANNVSE